MKFNFSDRYKAAFGFVSNRISATLAESGWETAMRKRNSNFQASVYVLNQNTHFDEVKFYRDDNGDKQEYLFAYRELAEEYNTVFATPPMLSLSRSKRLIITPIDNSNGMEVIERFNTEPYQITFKGLLIDMEEHQFPMDKLVTLNEIFEVNSIWNVASEILSAVNVESIVIRDMNVEFVEGYEDTISYTITALAVKPIQYQLLNEE